MRTRLGLLSLTAVMTLTIAACGRTDRSTEYGSVGSDSVKRDNAAAPAPAAAPSRGTSDAPAREAAPRRSLAAGTSITLRNDSTISSRRQEVGDRIVASSTTDALDASNRVVIPAGTKFIGTITRIESASGNNDTARLDLQFNAVELNGTATPIALEVTGFDVVARGRGVTAEEGAKVGAGAIIGGVAGRVIGGNTRGAVVGAVVGGAAGAVVANATRETDIVVDRGGAIQVRLTRDFARTVASN